MIVTVHWLRGSGFKALGSAPPLAAEAASLIEKETSALRRLIRGLEVGGWRQKIISVRFEVGS